MSWKNPSHFPVQSKGSLVIPPLMDLQSPSVKALIS